MVQPGAQLGHLTYCPVSGVVFKVQPASAKRELDGKTIYFCCESCASYFSENRERVIAARKLGPGPAR